MKENVINNKR